MKKIFKWLIDKWIAALFQHQLIASTAAVVSGMNFSAKVAFQLDRK
ncbi:MAG: hypothetical protein Q8M15_14540 [Bacteroidota bacterium]|nr:hypothetical protein [Bacteroidota bacterium]